MENGKVNILEALSKGYAVDRSQSYSAVPIIVQAPGSEEACITPKPTEFMPVDMNNLIMSKPDIFEDTITNDSDSEKLILIGCGILGSIASFASKFGYTDQLTITSVDCTDDFGSNTQKLIWLNANIAGNKAILKSIKVRTESETQIAKPITSLSINLNGEKYPVKQQFTKVDKNLNYAMLENCAMPINFYQGFLYPIGAGETVTIEATIAGIETMAGMSPKLQH